MATTTGIKDFFFCKLFAICIITIILAGCATNNQEQTDGENHLPNGTITQTAVIHTDEQNGVEQVSRGETEIEVASVKTSSSSFSDILDPLFVLDKNINTGWASSGETYSASITLVFPVPTTITRIRIYISQARKDQIKQIILQYDNERNQKLIIDNNEGWQEFTLHQELVAQIELKISDVQEEHRFTNVFIPEIEIFGVK